MGFFYSTCVSLLFLIKMAYSKQVEVINLRKSSLSGLLDHSKEGLFLAKGKQDEPLVRVKLESQSNGCKDRLALQAVFRA